MDTSTLTLSSDVSPVPQTEAEEGQHRTQSPSLPLPLALSPGGLGGKTRDARLIERAIRERWPIPDDMRPLAVKVLRRVMEDEGAPARDRIAAVKALATLEGQNMEARGEKGSATHQNIGSIILNIIQQEKDALLPSLPSITDNDHVLDAIKHSENHTTYQG